MAVNLEGQGVAGQAVGGSAASPVSILTMTRSDAVAVLTDFRDERVHRIGRMSGGDLGGGFSRTGCTDEGRHGRWKEQTDAGTNHDA
jgi:hypothetical protein